MKAVGILISGMGSNMEALARHHYIRDKVKLVISNNPNAEGLKKAKNLELPSLVIDHQDFPSRKEFEIALVQSLREAKVSLVCLAGFMRLLTKEFLSHFPTVNVHPSLLPKFKGNFRIHERVLKSGEKVSGCTIHQVTEVMDDENAILAQEKVPVMRDDTPSTLAARVLKTEHDLYPKTVQKILTGEITLKFPLA